MRPRAPRRRLGHGMRIERAAAQTGPRLAEVVAPDGVVGGVDDAVGVAVAANEWRHFCRVAEALAPDLVVGGVDRAVEIVVAGHERRRVGPPGEREVGRERAAAGVADLQLVCAWRCVGGQRKMEMLDVVGRGDRFGDHRVERVEHAEVEVGELAEGIGVDVVDDPVAVAFDDDPVPDERGREERASGEGLVEYVRMQGG